MDNYHDKYLEYKIKYINLKKQMKGGYVPPPPAKFNIGDRVENVFTNETGVITNLRILEINPSESQNLYTVSYDNGNVNTANDRALISAGPAYIVPYPPQTKQPVIIKNTDPYNVYNPYNPQANPYNPLNPYNPHNLPSVYKPTYYYDDEDDKYLRKASRKSSRKSRKSSRRSSKKSKKSSKKSSKKGSRK
jgi:hypothetical protein